MVLLNCMTSNIRLEMQHQYFFWISSHTHHV